jgi:hypothetical protein
VSLSCQSGESRATVIFKLFRSNCHVWLPFPPCCPTSQPYSRSFILVLVAGHVDIEPAPRAASWLVYAEARNERKHRAKSLCERIGRYVFTILSSKVNCAHSDRFRFIAACGYNVATRRVIPPPNSPTHNPQPLPLALQESAKTGYGSCKGRRSKPISITRSQAEARPLSQRVQIIVKPSPRHYKETSTLGSQWEPPYRFIDWFTCSGALRSISY